jgi:hypothetical protein
MKLIFKFSNFLYFNLPGSVPNGLTEAWDTAGNWLACGLTQSQD